MTLEVLLPLAAFVAMDVAVIAILWRIVVAGGAARRVSDAIASATDIAHRADVTISKLAAEMDDQRHRHELVSDAATAALVAATAETRRLIDDAREAERRSHSPAVGQLVAELERAGRALEMIRHGRGIVTGGDDYRGEGDHAMKRGYLDLVHARDALRERAKQVRVETAAAATARPEGRTQYHHR